MLIYCASETEVMYKRIPLTILGCCHHNYKKHCPLKCFYNALTIGLAGRGLLYRLARPCQLISGGGHTSLHQVTTAEANLFLVTVTLQCTSFLDCTNLRCLMPFNF